MREKSTANKFGIFLRILIQSVLSSVRAFGEIVKSYLVKINLLHNVEAKIKRERHCYFFFALYFIFVFLQFLSKKKVSFFSIAVLTAKK